MGAALAGLGVTVLAVVLYGLMRGNWLEALLAAIALAMSLLPEEFPVVLTGVHGHGGLADFAARVLTRRAAAIEALGSATVLCTDKTGTSRRTGWRSPSCGSPGARHPGPGERELCPSGLGELVDFGVLASARGAVRSDGEGVPRSCRNGERDDARISGLPRLTVYGLRPDLLAVTRCGSGSTAERIIRRRQGGPRSHRGAVSSATRSERA